MKDLERLLIKKASGYTVKEKVVEYIIDENGVKRAVKEKQQTKYIPPDISALKAYMELSGGGMEDMTDEELEKERIRLIGSLKGVEEDNQS